MRFTYQIYPEGLKKLKAAGIPERVKKVEASEDGLPFIGGSITERDIINSVEWLKENDFMKNLPDDHKKRLNKIFKKPENFHWQVERPSTTTKEPAELEDLLLFTGHTASLVLTPEELWSPERFGFNSASSLVTTVGAFVRQASHGNNIRKGYEWTKTENSITTLAEITGDGNGDLRVFQRDITPHPTTDPFDNQTFVRPETMDDKKGLAPYHSTEPSLLVTVLRYATQIGLNLNLDEIIGWGAMLRTKSGSSTENFGSMMSHPNLYFAAHELPIPSLGSKMSPYQLICTSETCYNAFLGDDNTLHMVCRGRDIPEKTVMTFTPQDTEHIIKGLLYQSANSLGRTHINTLIDMLHYRTSNKFKKRFPKL